MNLATGLILAGLAVHVLGNAQKLWGQAKDKVTPSTNDLLYYLATLALVVGVGMSWKKLT